ncbi:hypothetical protein DFH07DRAFT_416487 [Mycena maculata]|uniref:Uncharacterized protein n=1 Tax=Mycena maculata TaxID=230809 RepID=A0AAD7NIX6_9AGAR|nr:hypothetical protein DFH07DRAFT_416487 [Mycena maculata]
MFLRKLSFLAASVFAFAYMASVETPKVIHPASILTDPPFRLPTCAMGEYYEPPLGFSPANFTVHYSDHIVLSSLAIAKVEPPDDLLPSMGLANGFSPPFAIALTDLDLEKLELVFGATLTAARTIRAKTGLVWWKVFLCLFVLGEMAVSEGLGLGDGGATLGLLLFIARAGVNALLSMLAVFSVIKMRRALSFCVGVLQHASMIPGLVPFPFDVPLPHFISILLVDGTLVSILASKLPFPHWLRFIFSAPRPPAPRAKKRRYKHDRRRSKGKPPLPASTIVKLHRALRLGLGTLGQVLSIPGVIPFDVPLLHLLYAVALDGTLVSVLVMVSSVLLRPPSPPPAPSVRRAKTRYKRRAKRKT